MAKSELCRFCLKIKRDEKFYIIGNNILEMLKVLLIEMDVSTDGTSLICNDCQDGIERSFNFKITCLNSEDIIARYVTESSKLDLKEVYLKKKSGLEFKGILRCHKICRLCIEITETAKHLNGVNELTLTKDELQKYIPEINLSAVRNPVVCDACLLGLQVYTDFVTSCLNIEKKINRYCEAKRVDKKQVQLYNVLQFILDEPLECSIGEYAASRNMRKLDQSNIGSDCTNIGAIEFNIKSEKNNMKYEEDNEGSNNKDMNWNGETGLINGGQVFCHGVRRFIVNEDMNCDKNGDDLDTEEEKYKFVSLPRLIKEENVDEDQLKFSETNVMEESGAEMNIKNEEIEIKSEDAYMSKSEDYKSQQNDLRIKSCKKKYRKKKVFFCGICSARYSTKNMLAIHKLNIHGESAQTRLYECDRCAYISIYKANFIKHRSVHKNLSKIKFYKCPKCQYDSKYQANLKLHLLIHEQDSEVQAVNKHMLVGKGNSEVHPYTCSLCPYMGESRSHMRKHEITHKSKSELATFDCFHCPYKAKLKTHLRNHMKTHKSLNELIPYKCNTCGFITKYGDYFKRHLLGHKDQAEIELFRCDKCIFQTKYKNNLRNHMMNHMGISQLKNFKCEICPYRAKSRYAVKRHSAIHPEIKQSPLTVHQCEHCSYQSRDKSSFNRHLRVHNDNTLRDLPVFKCFLCSYQTNNKGNLRTHVRIHGKSSSTQLLKCGTCGGEYNKFYIKRHQSTCVGQEALRPDPCKV